MALPQQDDDGQSLDQIMATFRLKHEQPLQPVTRTHCQCALIGGAGCGRRRHPLKCFCGCCCCCSLLYCLDRSLLRPIRWGIIGCGAVCDSTRHALRVLPCASIQRVPQRPSPDKGVRQRCGRRHASQRTGRRPGWLGWAWLVSFVCLIPDRSKPSSSLRSTRSRSSTPLPRHRACSLGAASPRGRHLSPTLMSMPSTSPPRQAHIMKWRLRLPSDAIDAQLWRRRYVLPGSLACSRSP